MEDTTSTATQEQSWSSLPADLLKTIVNLLPWSSHPSFAATCKHWRSAVSPFYPAWITPILLNATDVGSTNIRYYSPYYHKNFEVDKTLETPNAKFSCANGHRLTLCQHDGTELIVVHTNLVTGKTYSLCPLERTGFDVVVYDGAQRMFGINMFEIYRAIESDGGGWYDWQFSEYNHDLGRLNVSPMTNPVFHRGLLYLLDVDRRLAVYDDSRLDEGFKILDVPKGFGFECDGYYLFESDEGELMAVLMGCRGPLVHVVKLNEQNMEWEEVKSLEGRALFTGTLTTTMVKTGVKWMQNKIFVPRLYDWPETIRVDLVDREGEVAFVPLSAGAAQHGGAEGRNIWACGLGPEEAPEFWETIKVDYSIWVNFRN
uniref:Uncharacterized protein n=2 Tax=Setaria viridis TaxID=4556 RepID=A0A4U6VSX1_SETVI|nr:uncharacterized protein LOC117844224 [Setaria viridis]XP_034580872.1 uncharacterized protein LOC117844227 [Setaria viridis]TKW32981.1 hypothetical protein SEVIR_2G202600v2 [Setaria viridis]TKW32987.1 hypothetical protein SEVIR_2G202950v2 [Setaria viridis]